MRTITKSWVASSFLGIIGLSFSSVSQAQLTFNFIPAGGTPANVIAGFQAAANRWSAIFNDNMVVNVNISFPSLGSGILGSTGSTQNTYTYASTKTALTTDKKSADDNTAVASLPTTSVPLYMNRTTDNPNGANSATPFLDNNNSANNSTIRMTNGNAKALGLLAGNNAASDASIAFSSNFTWDFDPTDGISGSAFDFVGVATHEIGHALGFISGVDVLDGNGTGFASDAFTFVSTLDLYRYSTGSIQALAGARDWSADNRVKYFSLDGGTTVGSEFATGTNFGDGRQASHWKDNLGIGILDPTAAPGELLAISSNDIQAFDVIGYDLITRQSVPEPGSVAMLFGATAGLGLIAVKRRNRR